MSEWQPTGDVKLLTELPVPALYDGQLALFTRENMHVEQALPFDSASAVEALKSHVGAHVVGGDFGGDKGVLSSFQVTDAGLAATSEYQDGIQGDLGANYLSSIKRAADFATQAELPLGLSWGGPLVGTKPQPFYKITTFMSDMAAAGYDDFHQVSPAIKAILNDGPAGVISGAVEAYKQFKATTVLFIINGGGIGLGVLKDGVIYATETGHVEAIPVLNTYGQTEPCGVFGATHVCLESVGANKKGIETQWQDRTGSYMRARDIEDQYKSGDLFASEIYDHSALVLAHALQGAARALSIDLASGDTAVVGHGGAFKFPAYGARIMQILEAYNQKPVQFLMTKDYCAEGSNACLDGAAIAALIA